MTILRALDPRTRAREQARAAAARASSKTLRVEVRTLRAELRGLAMQLDAMERQQELLSVLLKEETAAAARLDQLAGILDAARVGAHVREAVARATLVERPIPHAIIRNFLPADVYGAAIAAIPAPIFFERSPGCTGKLAVPPKLAPSDSVVTWAFLSDIARTVLAPALEEHFRVPLLTRSPEIFRDMQGCADSALSAGPGYLLCLRPGDLGRAAGTERSCIRTTLFLARPGDSEDFGSALTSPDASGDLQIPFQPNVALVTLDPLDTHERMAIAPTAPSGTTRHCYVMPISGVGLAE